jgi:hypothetical protein
MKKLKLSLDELRVDSFRTDEQDAEQRGTVRGNASDSTCLERVCTCQEETKWDITCGSCLMDGETCYNTCRTYWNCPTAYYYPGCS